MHQLTQQKDHQEQSAGCGVADVGLRLLLDQDAQVQVHVVVVCVAAHGGVEFFKVDVAAAVGVGLLEQRLDVL